MCDGLNKKIILKYYLQWAVNFKEMYFLSKWMDRNKIKNYVAKKHVGINHSSELSDTINQVIF